MWEKKLLGIVQFQLLHFNFITCIDSNVFMNPLGDSEDGYGCSNKHCINYASTYNPLCTPLFYPEISDQLDCNMNQCKVLNAMTFNHTTRKCM